MKTMEIEAESGVALLLACSASPIGEAPLSARDARSKAFRALMQAGYATRLGTAKMIITPTGRAFLAGIKYGEARIGRGLAKAGI